MMDIVSYIVGRRCSCLLLRNLRPSTRSATSIASILRFLGVLNKAYLDSPYALTDVRVLFEIGLAGGVVASTLTRDLHLDPAYLSRILKRFRDDGLIETKPDPDDLRSQIITVTDKGQGQFHEFVRRSRAEIAGHFDALAVGAA